MSDFWAITTLCIAVMIIGGGVHAHLKNRKASKTVQEIVDRMQKVERP